MAMPMTPLFVAVAMTAVAHGLSRDEALQIAEDMHHEFGTRPISQQTNAQFIDAVIAKITEAKGRR